jgi:hypothetical protein
MSLTQVSREVKECSKPAGRKKCCGRTKERKGEEEEGEEGEEGESRRLQKGFVIRYRGG